MVLRDLTELAYTSAQHLPQILSSITALSAKLTLIALHHGDVPLPSWPAHLPPASTLLSHLATTILTPTSLPQYVARVKAAGKAMPDPRDAELESADILTTLGRNSPAILVRTEHRRRSGRAVVDHCVVDAEQLYSRDTAGGSGEMWSIAGIVRRPMDVPELAALSRSIDGPATLATATGEHTAGTTNSGTEDMPFNLSLDDRERAARDRVHLPHFSAMDDDGAGHQYISDKTATATGGGSGGYLYYEPDSGDDLDDEEPDDDLY